MGPRLKTHPIRVDQRFQCANARRSESGPRIRRMPPAQIVLRDASVGRVRWRTEGWTALAYNRAMPPHTRARELPEDESTLAAALWVLVAVAWFVMAVLFIRHGFFSAIILLVTALICLPSLRSYFRHLTGIRFPWPATAATVLALGSVISASQNTDARQFRQQQAPSTSEEAVPGSMPRTSTHETTDRRLNAR